ncbi:HAD hydrolase family protein, partial [Enterococcus faecalis]
GTGVAMGNATENVKTIADVHTNSNDEDGVAQLIEKMVLI